MLQARCVGGALKRCVGGAVKRDNLRRGVWRAKGSFPCLLRNTCAVSTLLARLLTVCPRQVFLGCLAVADTIVNLSSLCSDRRSNDGEDDFV